MEADKAKRSLKEIFLSTFHNKVSFQDFLNLDVNSEFRLIQLRKRTVYAPSIKLKRIHRFINNSILEFADYNHDVVFSYRKGFSARDAVEKHSKNKFFFQTDLSSFYDNIDRNNVKLSLENQLENTPVSDVRTYIERIVDLVVVNNHIPAGFSTSPLLSNICLYRFDNELDKHCQKHDLKYSRYSDDLIISGNSDDALKDIENTIKEFLKLFVNEKISINESKTKSHKRGQDFKLLGFKILPNGLVTIPSSDKNEIESLIYFYLTDSEKLEDFFRKISNSKKLEVDDKSLREIAIGTLSGKLIAFNSMDKKYISKLRRKYGNTVIDMFIRKSVK